MNKNYLITLLLTISISALSFGQEMLVNGNLEGWDDTSTPTSWDKAENITQETTVVHGGGSSAFRNGGSKTKDLSQNITGIVGGDSYTISIWYKADGDGTDARIWSYWRTGTTNINDNVDELRGPNNSYFDNNGNVWSEYTVTLDAPAAADAFFFEVRSYSNSTVYWDDLSFVHNVTSEPSLNIASPSNNTTFSPETKDVPITVSVANFAFSADDGSGASDGSGDGYIKGTLEATGEAPEEEVFFSALADEFSVETGVEYTLTMELVDNSGTSLSPAVASSVTFSVASYTQAATISDIRAGTEGAYYELTGEAIMTFDTANSRNQKYIQDASGAILIDDSAGVISTSYVVGDGISGIKGKLSAFQGVLQFVPQVDPGVASNTGISFTAEVVTIAELTANFEDYESEWITINDVSFSAADGTATFASSENYDITDGTNTLVFRTAFSNADLIGEVIPSLSINVTGPAAESSGTARILGTSLANIVLGLEKNTLPGFSAYPNPVTGGALTVTTSSTALKTLNIFNVLGKNVFSQQFSAMNETIDISRISSGLYIIKVSQGDTIATKKLIIE